MGCNAVDEVAKIGASSWKDDGTKEIYKDHEAHAEAAESTQVFKEDQFSQIVDGRIDPTTPLRE